MADDREMTLREAANHAATVLPEGWTIRIEIEKDSGWVELEDPFGDIAEYASNRETIEDSFNDAIKHAIEHDKDYQND